MKPLTISELKIEAGQFARDLQNTPIPDLYGVTDGKAVGTYVEHRFHEYLQSRYTYTAGSSASGLDFPELEVELKVTSGKQPQSSCPFRSASQKVYGLDYSLLVFVYDKTDDPSSNSAVLNIKHAIFVAKERTADYQTTYGILEILRREGNMDDLIAFLIERNLPLDDIGRQELARRVLHEPPVLGYLTISNALQWRLQYSRIIQFAESESREGVENILG